MLLSLSVEVVVAFVARRVHVAGFLAAGAVVADARAVTLIGLCCC